MTDVAEQVAQIRLDLYDVEQQVAAGEIDEETAERLRSLYRSELEALSTASGSTTAPETSRSRPRLVAGALILVIGFATTIAVLGATADDSSGALQGIASRGEFDPEDYSDETMEAVIAANADDLQVAAQLPFMRFALAERYFERGEFQRAFSHYEAILAGDPSSTLFTSTMTRIAWITFVGNGEVELALQVIDRAIEATPASTEAIYVKGQILWCGSGDAPAATELFQQVLASDQLDGTTRSQVEADLALASTGEPCA